MEDKKEQGGQQEPPRSFAYRIRELAIGYVVGIASIATWEWPTTAARICSLARPLCGF